MSLLISSIRWSWLLSIALLIPISLPAGGAQKELLHLRKLSGSNQIMSGDLCEFRLSPFINSTVIGKVPIGMTMSTLKYWQNEVGANWILVKISSIPLLDDIHFPRKGWVHID